jgi:hypothetical protein
MTDDYNGDFLIADEKIRQGNDWDGEMTIPVAGEQLTFGYTLLDERVRQQVETTLPLEEFQQYKQDDMSEDHERLMELQRKSSLTDEEEDELLELVEEVNPEDEARDSLPDEAVNAIMDAGVHAIEPTDGDIQDVVMTDPEVQEDIFGEDVPTHMDEETVRDPLREYMRERIEEQPFPIKFSLGQQAWMETVSVLGNGFPSQ